MSFFWDLKTIPIFLLLSIPKTTCRECGSSVQERVPQIFSFYHGQQPNPALFDQRPSIRTLSNGTCRSSTHSSAVGEIFFQPYLWKAALANCASPAIVLQGVSLVYRLNYDPQEFLLFSGFTPRLRRVTIDGIRLAWLPSLFANLTFLYYTHDSSWKASRFINTVDFEFHILLRVPAWGGFTSGRYRLDLFCIMPRQIGLFTFARRLCHQVHYPPIADTYAINCRWIRHPF